MWQIKRGLFGKLSCLFVDLDYVVVGHVKKKNISFMICVIYIFNETEHINH